VGVRGVAGGGRLVVGDRRAPKTLFLVRHCAATGQAPEAPLTADGQDQAEALAERLTGAEIERIITSPYLRARQSAEPLAGRLELPVELDSRLAERVLGTGDLVDWRQRLRETFDDDDLCFAGGESSRTATARGVAAVNDVIRSRVTTTAVVTHGNLLALVLRHFDGRIGFEAWEGMTSPGVYRLTVRGSEARIKRLWANA
jgi:2,3-bisphosphoglycerate-dependent phosphoglycerate mutase